MISTETHSAPKKNEDSIFLEQDQLFQSFLKFARVHSLFQKGERVLVAVSGGLDSTVLAHVMVRASRALELHVEFVHVDHGTRAMASQREALWVKVLGDRLGVQTHMKKLSEYVTLKSQDGMREARRELLFETMTQGSAQKIATAHHGDDNAETFLMRAMSGTGTSGLACMSPIDGVWVKPLLSFTREDLLQYARRFRLAWVEDPTNANAPYFRNRVRNEIFPILENVRSGSIRNISRLAERCAEEELELEEWLEAQFEGPKESLSRAFLEKYPDSLGRRILKIWIHKLGLKHDPRLVEALLDGQELVHSAGVFVRRSDHILFMQENDFSAPWKQPIDVEISRRVNLGTSCAWGFLGSQLKALSNYQLSVFFLFRPPQHQASENCQLMNWDRLPWPLVLRARQSDDPRRELDEILSRKKIPRPFWRDWPLLVSRDDPSKIVAMVALSPLKEYHLTGVGRCVSMESLIEEIS